MMLVLLLLLLFLLVLRLLAICLSVYRLFCVVFLSVLLASVPYAWYTVRRGAINRLRKSRRLACEFGYVSLLFFSGSAAAVSVLGHLAGSEAVVELGCR